AILRREVPQLSREGNQWRLNVEGRELLVVADPGSDRMRVFSPIGDAQSVEPEQILRMMVANFHTSLDARYAFIGDGTVVALYLHPLSSLQERDLRSALRQVAELANTFGTTYSSGDMLFGPGTRPGNANPRETDVI
ncbi:MAG: type III secretion system chaperone, partial [Cyanobacteria bacterium J06641_5]